MSTESVWKTPKAWRDHLLQEVEWAKRSGYPDLAELEQQLLKAEEDVADTREGERKVNRQENVVYHIHIERRPPPPQKR